MPGPDDLAASIRRARIVIDTNIDAFVRAAESANAGAAYRPWGPTAPGHLTAIAWAVDQPSRHILLANHRLHGWSCPGGHLEADEHPLDGATRELREETGITAAPASLVPLSFGYSVGCARAPGQAVGHWTLGYLFRISDRRELRAEADQPVAWFPLDRLPSPRAADIDLVVSYLLSRITLGEDQLGSIGSIGSMPGY